MSRYAKGWIKLYRDLADGDIAQNTHCLGLWVQLLLWATRYETKLRSGSTAVTVPPGTIITSFRQLAQRGDIDRRTVKKHLLYLESRGSISMKMGPLGIVVTICNWNDYQLEEKNHAHYMYHDVYRQVPLNGERRTKNKKETAEKKPSAGAELWVYYAERLTKLKKLTPIQPRQKERNLCKSLAEEFGIEEARSLVDRFLSDDDEWLSKRAWSFEFLWTRRQQYANTPAQAAVVKLRVEDFL